MFQERPISCYSCLVLYLDDLDRCVGSFNTLNNMSNRLWVANKTGNLNILAFDMITGINESKVFTKHISYKSQCKFDYRKCNPNQKWNKNKCHC